MQRFHPWIFSGAVAQVEGDPQSGDTVDVFGGGGQFLARGAYSHHSQILCRLWTWDQADVIDAEFFRKRMIQALDRRKKLVDRAITNAFRLVHAESDGIPGLIVDRYADTLVAQFLSSGVEARRKMIVDLLAELTGAPAIYERSDAEVRKLEGLNPRTGLLFGEDSGNEVTITEGESRYLVPFKSGHKTGFYLDQRSNREMVGGLSENKEVLDCFSYSGGFAIKAMAGGAERVTLLDSSVAALELARRNFELNSLDLSKVDLIEADVFTQLRKFRDARRRFDLIVLDPPKFAPTRAQVNKASRAYKDINLLAFKLLRPGGHLVTFSCSGGLDPALFQKIVADAAVDAGVGAQIIKRLSQDEDHPVALNFPEGAYLKGLVCRVNQ